MAASTSSSCSGRLDPEHVYVLFLHGGAEELLRYRDSGASMAEAGSGKPISTFRSRAGGRRESAESAILEESAKSAVVEEPARMVAQFTRLLHSQVGNQDEGSPDSDFNGPSVNAAIRNKGIPAATLFPLQNQSSDVNDQALSLNSGNSSSKILPLKGHSVYLDRGLHPRSSISSCPLHSKIDVENYEEFRDWIYSFEDDYFSTIFDVCTLIHIDISQVVRHRSFEECLGVPLQQTVSDTCALVSSTVCIEAHHRLQYEMVHGAGTFPCIAAAPRKLRNSCYRHLIWTWDKRDYRRIWDQDQGAIVGEVLDKIMELGGVRTTNAPPPAPSFLPLRSWQLHMWEDGLSADDVADLLDSHGPFIGNIWVCPWYHLFDSDEDDDLVYWSGCARSEEMKDTSKAVFGADEVGYHSVVCFEYRFCNGQMHVHVLDNHAANGPKRWIHYEELEDIYTIEVELMKIDRRRQITYPHSGFYS